MKAPTPLHTYRYMYRVSAFLDEECIARVRVLVENVEKMKEAMPMTDMEKYSSELEKVGINDCQ